MLSSRPSLPVAGSQPNTLALCDPALFAEHLSDRREADAARSRIDWKYLLGLGADCPWPRCLRPDRVIFPRMRGHQVGSCLPLGLFGREIPERRVDALAIVVAFDVAEQIPLGLFVRHPAALMNQFQPSRWKRCWSVRL